MAASSFDASYRPSRQWRRQDLVSGGTTIEAPKARALRRRVGWGMGKGVRSAADYGVWGSVVSSPSEVRGGAPAAIAYSAYFRPQNASGSKKNTACIKLQRGGTCPSAPCLATPLPRGGECSRPPRVPRAGEQCGMHSFEGRLRYDWLVHVIPPQQNAPFHERSFVSINRRFLGHTGDCPKWHLDRFSRFAQLTLLRSLSNDPLNFKTRCNFVQF